MAPGRTRFVWVLCGLLAGLSGCGSRAGNAEAAQVAAPDVSPTRQIDWLPAEAAAVAYFDVAALRQTELYRSLARYLPEHPPLRSVFDRTNSFRIAVVASGSEAQLVGLFQGDYDDHAHPAALSDESMERQSFDGREVLVRPSSGDRWFHTPEGFWIVSEAGLWSNVARAPEQRTTRLSASDWARPLATPHFAHASITMSPLWREQIGVSVSDPLVAALLMPAIEELEIISLDLLPELNGGLALRLGADFQSSRGAQAAAFILQAGMVAARAQAQGLVFPGDALADGGAPEAATGEQLISQQLGAIFGQMLDDLDVVVENDHLRATLVVPGDDVARVRDQLSEALDNATD
jgi:hypothetical protein